MLSIPICGFVIHTFYQVPYPEWIDLLLVNHRQMRAIKHRRKRKIGSPSQLLAERRDDFLDCRNQSIAVAEVIEKDDAPAGLADPDHLQHDLPVVRDGGHHVCCHDGVKRVICKFHGSRIHPRHLHVV